MSKITTLRKAILRAEEGSVIYAQIPFSAESRAMIVELDVDAYPQEDVNLQGFEMFLDTDTTNELLDVIHDVQVSEDQLVELVLYYAENHDYPGWMRARVSW
jgi:hypothetical protein